MPDQPLISQPLAAAPLAAPAQPWMARNRAALAAPRQHAAAPAAWPLAAPEIAHRARRALEARAQQQPRQQARGPKPGPAAPCPAGFRVAGPHQETAKDPVTAATTAPGLRYDAGQVLLDPYARAIVSRR
jgi:type II secretory pathway component HofQ